ncbi:uncharacterized protein KY384_009094 [Bacidia gigantensis]|uniref:uncharacterized protein n=1 Tax=Bacidia gigantensis TaxID=2732470 RepID=UPI001D045EB0|nr:uncharacterized protein KY384_009094 [Bacidia gigantensis]KAG8525450.1 hypothetical protein KY384_009094 [Bacidia gigantensis]
MSLAPGSSKASATLSQTSSPITASSLPFARGSAEDILYTILMNAIGKKMSQKLEIHIHTTSKGPSEARIPRVAHELIHFQYWRRRHVPTRLITK